MRFLWTDIETTGLNPATREIIQLGMIVTTTDLVEVARFEHTIRHSRIPYGNWDPEAFRMHEKTGLVAAYEKAPFDLDEVHVLARAFALEHAGPKAVMAGNSVHFDRGFLVKHMPKLVEPLHHRMLDVSFFKVIAEAWNVHVVPATTGSAHTALADLDGSIAMFKWALKASFKPTSLSRPLAVELAA